MGFGETAIIFGLGATVLMIGLFVQLLINTCAMWIVMNYMMEDVHQAGFLKCMLATFLLSVVLIVAIVCLLLPLPCLLNVVLAIFVWYYGSIAVIEGTFDMVRGALGVLVLFLIINFGINMLLNAMF